MEPSALLQRVSHFPPLEPNPVLLEHAKERAESVQNRIADRITKFAGSMLFVYIHVAWFGIWIGLGVEGYPSRTSSGRPSRRRTSRTKSCSSSRTRSST
jgi:hypothetical protein